MEWSRLQIISELRVSACGMCECGSEHHTILWYIIIIMLFKIPDLTARERFLGIQFHFKITQTLSLQRVLNILNARWGSFEQNSMWSLLRGCFVVYSILCCQTVAVAAEIFTILEFYFVLRPQ